MPLDQRMAKRSLKDDLIKDRSKLTFPAIKRTLTRICTVAITGLTSAGTTPFQKTETEHKSEGESGSQRLFLLFSYAQTFASTQNTTWISAHQIIVQGSKG